MLEFNENEFCLIKSTRKGNKLIFEHFQYTIRRETEDEIIWRCADRNCQAEIRTNKEIKKYNLSSKNHSHGADYDKITKLLISENLKDLALNSKYTSKQILNELLLKWNNKGINLFKINSLYKNIENYRKRGNVSTNNTLGILPENHLTFDNKKFLQFDSGIDVCRKIVFISEDNVDRLKKCNTWIGDGTFYISPNDFLQAYTIHIVYLGKSLPAGYILLSTKSFVDYKIIFDEIRKILGNFDGPKYYVADFEIAPIKAIKEIFPNVKIYFCLFHMSQILWRRIQSLGLVKEYKENYNFRLLIKMLLSLAFVEKKFVLEEFEKLKKWAINNNIYNKAKDLFIYFFNQFISENAPFDSVNWSARERIILNIPLTTNSAEAWNKEINKGSYHAHPSLNEFIGIIKNDEIKTNQKISNLILNPNKIKIVEKYDKIKNIINNYEEYAGIDFLKAIATSYNWKIE